MKTMIRISFALLYGIAMVASVIIIIKPGAAIFQYMIHLPVEKCPSDAGFAYRCEVDLPETIFPANKVVLYKDAEQMTKLSKMKVVQEGNGTYIAELSKDGKYYLYFAPAGNKNPGLEREGYRVYFGILFFQPSMGILYLTVLLIGLIRFLRFSYSAPKATKNEVVDPAGTLLLLDRFFDHEKSTAKEFLATLQSIASTGIRENLAVWEKIILDTGWAILGLVVLEWLFLITTVSFMDKMNIGQRIEILILSILVISLVGIMVLLILMALSFLLRFVFLSGIPILMAKMVPAIVYSVFVVVMVENFTYVVFHFGILTSSGFQRALYGILIGIGFIYFYGQRLKELLSRKIIRFSGIYRWGEGFFLGVLSIAIVIAVQKYQPRMAENTMPTLSGGSAHGQPNIILIGTDGLSADSMSLYGYARKTTPNIDQLAEVSLVADNTFTNVGTSAGSIVSIFTSKWPTQTGVLYPPNILEGADALEHLPGMLSRDGYATVELSVPYYADSSAVNIQDGFDSVNGLPTYTDPVIRILRNNGYDSSAYFIYLLEKKITGLFLQAFYVDTVRNPFSLITQPDFTLDDGEKINQLEALISQSEKPLFLHVHLMGTHGPTFNLAQRKFSLGEEQTSWFMPDFYDDAILSFDQRMGEIVKYLKEIGKYQNTIIIIYSDHSEAWGNRGRIPLIFHFPEDRFKGHITVNAQNLDIAPTIIDYLGGEIPVWMEGQSLLGEGPNRGRLIFSTRPDDNEVKANGRGNYLDMSALHPPFYQFRFMEVIDCNHWYELDLHTRDLASGIVNGYTTPCAESELRSKEDILQNIIKYFAQQGYDVSSLQ